MSTPDLQLLRDRARLIHLIREFFRSRDYLEVDTALLCPSLIPESALEVFSTRYRPRHGGERDLFLIPSPELWMKRLIAAGAGSIFQICKSFRNSEPATHVHNPEFTMLEWYTLEADYLQSIDIIEALFGHLLTGLSVQPILTCGDRRVDCSAPFLRLSMAEAFRRYLKLDLEQLLDSGGEALAAAARRIGLSVTKEDDPEDLFHKIFLGAVEPNLPADRALILYDYPALIPTLARRKPRTPWAERWELYLAGVEIANCYSEETDPEAYEDFYTNQDRAKQQATVVHPSDRELLRIIRELGFPACSGVALGLERLFLFFLRQDSIRELLPFGAFNLSEDQSASDHT
jgi:lysyl-tRNA synthetase class 2